MLRGRAGNRGRAREAKEKTWGRTKNPINDASLFVRICAVHARTKEGVERLKSYRGRLTGGAVGEAAELMRDAGAEEEKLDD